MNPIPEIIQKEYKYPLMKNEIHKCKKSVFFNHLKLDYYERFNLGMLLISSDSETVFSPNLNNENS